MMNISQQAVLHEQDVVYYTLDSRVDIYLAYGDNRVRHCIKSLPDVFFRTYEGAQAYLPVYEQMIPELVERWYGGKEVVRIEHEPTIFERHMPFMVEENAPVELGKELHCWGVQTLDFEGLEDEQPPRFVVDGALIYRLGTHLEVEFMTMKFED